MYGRAGLDRFKKAQTLEPFSVNTNSASKTAAQPAVRTATQPGSKVLQPPVQNSYIQTQYQHNVHPKPVGQDAVQLVGLAQQVTQVGGGQSTWQPPDWAIEPLPGVYYLDVLKDGEVFGRIDLDKRRHIFGRQIQTCDFVLDHQSVSRQHAAVVPHKNGSIYVIDLGSAHGTFVANERLTKDNPVELEAGQSLRFAASTRSYILRKNEAALFPATPLPTEINLPPPPDPADEEAVVAYNTLLNRYGMRKPDVLSKSNESGSSLVRRDDILVSERAAKRIKKAKVVFRDQVGEELVEVVGVSDGADVETEPGPLGVKEGSLVGKYESLIQTTVIPKGKEQSVKEANVSQTGVTDKLLEILNKIKTAPKTGIYDDLYGESLSGKVGSSWAYPSNTSGESPVTPAKDSQVKSNTASSGELGGNSGHIKDDSDDDDLFGD